MIREIKFRVKIKGDAGIYTVWGIDWLNDKILAERACGNELIPFNKIQALMQLTPHKDKNGKEIWEGDVVKKMTEDYSATDDWAENDPRWNKELPLIEVCRDEVTLERFGYWLKNESFGYEGEGLEDSENFEVIGNIYKNPKLLKK